MSDEYLSYIQEHHPEAVRIIKFRLDCGFTVESIKYRFRNEYPGDEEQDLYFHDTEDSWITQELCHKFFPIRNHDLSLPELLIDLDFTPEAARKHTELILSVRPQIVREEYIFAILYLIQHLYFLQFREKEFALPENLLSVGRERYSAGCYFGCYED